MTIRRLKTYTGAQGYVYQYFLAEQRAASGTAAVEYVFDVTSDGRHSYPMKILLPREAADAWAAAHGRGLSETEQYAAAKIRLFRAFDDMPGMSEPGCAVEVDAQGLEEALSQLGVE